MADPNEIAALKSSFRGVLATAGALDALRDRIEAIEPAVDIAPADLDELARVTAAHAIASNALRGLVNTMQNRRGAATT
jgi:hypothetical protein